MKTTHAIKLSVFSKEEDNEQDVLNSFLSLFPFNLEEQKITLNKTNAEGFNQSKIKVFEVMLEKERHTTPFLKHLLEKLTPEQKELILRQAESRLDNELKLFLRFDKDKLMKENRLWLTDSGNCFHIKMSIASFPAKREAALEVVKGIFG